MKLDVYECDRCETEIKVEEGKVPPTVTEVDRRYPNAEVTTYHLCDDCHSTFFVSICSIKKVRDAVDKLADKLSGEVFDESE